MLLFQLGLHLDTLLADSPQHRTSQPYLVFVLIRGVLGVKGLTLLLFFFGNRCMRSPAFPTTFYGLQSAYGGRYRSTSNCTSGIHKTSIKGPTNKTA